MIDQTQVHHVANLARLKLSAAEEKAFEVQLNNIIGYFAQLNELDGELENVEPTTRAIDAENITRSDTPYPTQDIEVLLNCAPEREETFFRVPQIMG